MEAVGLITEKGYSIAEAERTGFWTAFIVDMPNKI
jgi:hypothetical protein